MCDIAKSTVERFLRDNGGTFEETIMDVDCWIMKDDSVIQLPIGFDRIDIEIFEEIAEQIGVSRWELDTYLS